MSTANLIAAFALGAALLAAASAVPAQVADDPSEDLGVVDEGSAWPGGIAAFADRPYDVYDAVGVVIDMEPAGPFVMIEGLRFGFDYDPDIRLRAGAGAPTLLAPGMVLEFYYRDEDDDDLAGRIIAAIELAPDARQPD